MMRIILGALCLAGALGLTAVPANAQASRTWVSGVGDDANPCSRTAPCKTYAGAISKTATNGEINCLDPGGFGAVTITKSISIVCDYTEGGVLAAGVNGFIINAPAGSIITLKGQDVECFGTGLNGVNILGVGVTVHIHKFQIRNCRGANGNGILVAPSSGVAKVFVADSYITDNGTGTNAGILIKATANAATNVSINRVQFENNSNGIFFDSSGGASASNLTVRDSVLSGHPNNGIKVSSAAVAFKAVVENTIMSFNAVGANANGAGATLLIGDSTVMGNVTGVSATGGGTLQSFKNNEIGGNTADGTPITAFPGPGGTPLQ
jgi:hypothetical protein